MAKLNIYDKIKKANIPNIKFISLLQVICLAVIIIFSKRLPEYAYLVTGAWIVFTSITSYIGIKVYKAGYEKEGVILTSACWVLLIMFLFTLYFIIY